MHNVHTHNGAQTEFTMYETQDIVQVGLHVDVDLVPVIDGYVVCSIRDYHY